MINTQEPSGKPGQAPLPRRAGHVPTPPITMVLHQEQLTITRRAVPVEAVTVRVSRAQREHRIDETLRHEQVDIVELDLGSLDSVRAAAAEFLQKSGGRLNVLINNAGTSFCSPLPR